MHFQFFLESVGLQRKRLYLSFPVIYSISLIINTFLRNFAKLNFINHKLKQEPQLLKLYSTSFKNDNHTFAIISRLDLWQILAIDILWYFRSQKTKKMRWGLEGWKNSWSGNKAVKWDRPKRILILPSWTQSVTCWD